MYMSRREQTGLESAACGSLGRCARPGREPDGLTREISRVTCVHDTSANMLNEIDIIVISEMISVYCQSSGLSGLSGLL